MSDVMYLTLAHSKTDEIGGFFKKKSEYKIEQVGSRRPYRFFPLDFLLLSPPHIVSNMPEGTMRALWYTKVTPSGIDSQHFSFCYLAATFRGQASPNTQGRR